MIPGVLAASASPGMHCAERRYPTTWPYLTSEEQQAKSNKRRAASEEQNAG
jgi:hypothetical protein